MCGATGKDVLLSKADLQDQLFNQSSCIDLFGNYCKEEIDKQYWKGLVELQNLSHRYKDSKYKCTHLVSTGLPFVYFFSDVTLQVPVFCRVRLWLADHLLNNLDISTKSMRTARLNHEQMGFNSAQQLTMFLFMMLDLRLCMKE